MNLIKWNRKDVFDPMAEFDRLQDEIGRVFGVEGYRPLMGLFDGVRSPAIDVTEGDASFVLDCDLPGVELKDLDLSIANNVLTIKGQKKEERDSKDVKVYRQESWAGSFQRTLSLPNTVDPEKIEAVMKDGVLTVVLPKKEEVKPKQISVKVS